jgi:hypothetical protein
MPAQASTDRDLNRTGERQWSTGARLLLAGVLMYALGIAMMIVNGSVYSFPGLALVALGTPPLAAGVALGLTAVVAKRHSRHKPFA